MATICPSIREITTHTVTSDSNYNNLQIPLVDLMSSCNYTLPVPSYMLAANNASSHFEYLAIIPQLLTPYLFPAWKQAYTSL